MGRCDVTLMGRCDVCVAASGFVFVSSHFQSAVHGRVARAVRSPLARQPPCPVHQPFTEVTSRASVERSALVSSEVSSVLLDLPCDPVPIARLPRSCRLSARTRRPSFVSPHTPHRPPRRCAQFPQCSNMKAEIRSAVAFLGRFLTTSGFCPPELATFTKTMEKLLTEHYKHHWFPEQPHKGSGYRCIRINRKQPDPLVCRAACSVGLGPDSLLRLLPSELTLWVDPFEVSYRIGEDGSVCEIYQNQGLSRPPGVVQYTPSGVADFVTAPESSKDKVLAVKKERCGEKCSLFGNSLAVKS